VKDLINYVAKERFFAKEAQNDHKPAYEKTVFARNAVTD
jgi:hypothetical protein